MIQTIGYNIYSSREAVLLFHWKLSFYTIKQELLFYPPLQLKFWIVSDEFRVLEVFERFHKSLSRRMDGNVTNSVESFPLDYFLRKKNNHSF